MRVTLLLLSFLFTQIIFAQEKTISGIVSDESGGLPGVSIIIKGTTSGVESDFDGNFTIKGKQNDILVFSFVGKKTIEKKIGTSNKVNVSLLDDENLLTEIVVTALGRTTKDENLLTEIVVTALGRTTKKKSLGYAQTSVTGEALVKTNEVDINNSIAGKVSGVQAIGNSGATFDAADIRLRGNSNVLYVVDGIRVQSSADINTADIENISVLKGGAATALYGTDASGGVIVITSKKAKNGTQIQLQLSTEVGQATNQIEYQNEYGGGYGQTFGTLNGQLIPNYGADQSWGPKLDGRLVRHWDSWIVGDPEYGKLRPWSAVPNNVDDFYEDAYVRKAILTLQNGGDNHKISSILRHVDQEGILPNTGRKSTQISLNSEYNVTDKLTIAANINYQVRSTINNPELGYTGSGSFFRPNQWWQRQLDIKRLRNYKRNGQFVSWNIGSPTNPTPAYWDSPYFEFYENRNEQDKTSVFGKIGLNYAFSKSLSTTLQYRRTFNTFDFTRKRAFGGRGGETQPRFDESTTSTIEDEVFGSITKNMSFGENDAFKVEATAGFQIQNKQINNYFANTIGGLTTPGFYSIDSSVDRHFTQRFKGQEKKKSIFGNVNIGYDDFLFLDASLRSDWGSTPNPNNNRVITYGVSTSFVFSELINNNNVLNFGKLRAAYSSAPNFPGIYQINETYLSAGNYNGQPLYNIPSTQKNPLVSGASSKEKEAGLELKFFGSKIGVDLTYYNIVTEAFARNVSLAASTGFSSIQRNSGKETKSGWELGLNFKPVKTNNFSWESTLNLATINWVVNEIRSDDDPNTPTIRELDNVSIFNGDMRMRLRDTEGQQKGQIFGSRAKRDAQGRLLINNSITSDWDRGLFEIEKDVLLGNFLPDLTGGLTNTFKYKNFELSAAIDFQVGGDFYSTSKRWARGSGVSIETVGNNDKGNSIRDAVSDGGGIRVDGVDATTGSPVTRYVTAYAYFDRQLGAFGESSLFDASYVKLRQMSLSYTLPNQWFNKWGIKDVKASIYGNNLWLIYSTNEIDPSELENVSGTSLGRNGSGFRWQEGAQFPSQRTIGLNLNLTF